ncbi:MAG: hypothetical protein ABFS41_08380 [Myxococcota bacterium]
MRLLPLHFALPLLLTIAPAGAENPDSFESRSEIREWIEARRGFGSPKFELLTAGGSAYYFARFIPTSGLDHCHVYTFRKARDAWLLARHATFPGGCRITMRVDPRADAIVYVASDGTELDRLGLPR